MKKNLTPLSNEIKIKQMVERFRNTISTEQMVLLTQSYYKHNSLLALTKDWNLFIQYGQQHAVQILPASSLVVNQFIHHQAKTKKYNTLKRYVVTISIVHYLLNQPDPTNSIQVRNQLRHFRLDKKGEEKQAESFTRLHLNRLHKKLIRSNNSRDIRDLAIYHVMFECAMKRSELKQLTIEHIDLNGTNIQCLNIGTEQYSLSANAQCALLRWIKIVNEPSGPVFRAIDRHGNIAHLRLDDSSIFRILRRAGGLLSQPELRFSGQSTRIGAVKELARQGYKTKEIQQFGRWLSPAMPNQYLGNLHTAEVEKLKFVRFKPCE
ncbi:tyrosine-type recombinase/integrase [Vibrio sp. V27_P1S3P104]|uniref:tyrosine-type recombinase/integrase n=1 Tax=unclassified Vibrio TaxID=2614977 RepID=UPI001372E1A1|nr:MULTISPECIES: tyrosine-type recombinase/integrase [unclassified Vibrio]NAW70194.1 tyrosine-type recombinase/integrase [Vibrio sp. V28_P6S34P95]NAX05569.1 tyrosine-type recombinase/integrase [Vibrio sp. V30_P3S12P165]NAX33772.1 tyrosine-type recombinase/integrase [Vibrio sp. V29_P1S30P107]NAX38532.1 tyrosine-type recombinase/integrase [Vibrio sp. V27_P1S3P104]NAX39490.1 tyrosine-type recombinase/integrase [Vibrio sp. V26_P1S5P106]